MLFLFGRPCRKKAGASGKLSGEWRFSPKEETYGEGGDTRMVGARASVSDALKPMQQRPNAEGMAPEPSMSEPGTWTYLPTCAWRMRALLSIDECERAARFARERDRQRSWPRGDSCVQIWRATFAFRRSRYASTIPGALSDFLSGPKSSSVSFASALDRSLQL